jgi:hypothetical protein
VVEEMGKGKGYLVCFFTRMSNMGGLCISVNVSFNYRPFFVMYIYIYIYI